MGAKELAVLEGLKALVPVAEVITKELREHLAESTDGMPQTPTQSATAAKLDKVDSIIAALSAILGVL